MRQQLPSLAGLCSYAQAANPGYSVEENVQRLLRYVWIEKRLMETALAWLAPTPEWEAKEAFGLHAGLDAEHVAALRKRIGEMRNPAPRMDVTPDPALDSLFDELTSAGSTLEKLIGVYAVVRPALHSAYRQHLGCTNPVADYPTHHMLRHILLDEDVCQVWGATALEACLQTESAQVEAQSWQHHIEAYLAAAGGIAGVEPRLHDVPPSRAAQSLAPDYFPQRDDRFALRWTFVNPQRQVSLNELLPLDERTLALMCRRIVEMDVPEYMSRIIVEATDEPWEYFVDMTRQLWDEVSHAMLGEIYFEQRGIDWKTQIAIHPGMSIRLHSLDRDAAHMVLYAIEQNLMPGNTGKRLEYEISSNAQDVLAAHIQDYDWADEVLHVHIGRKWLLPKLGLRPSDAVAQGWELRARTAQVLDKYEHLGEQKNWWPDFTRLVLGRESGMTDFDLARL